MVLATNGHYWRPDRIVHISNVKLRHRRISIIGQEDHMLDFPEQLSFSSNISSCKLGRVLPDNWRTHDIHT